MRVVLFASAMLVAAGQARQLAQPASMHSLAGETFDSIPTIFAQTETEQIGGGGPGMLGSTPDPKQLKEKAAKAIDKDDLKKMGKEKHQVFHKVKKILQGKTSKSRDMAGVLEDIISGKDIPGIDKPSKPKKSSEESSDDGPSGLVEPLGKKCDKECNFKYIIKHIQSQLNDRTRQRERESKDKMEKVTKELKEKIKKMKDSMKERTQKDKKEAVAAYQEEQKKVNSQIYNTMKSQLPKQMRAVI